MAVTVTRSAGMLLLSVWLILTGIRGLVAFPLPPVLMAAVALIAGVLILVGR
jgi:cytochrome bd-type quinol oxidase subunit 2